MSYATPANLLSRYDYRTVGELIVDDNTQPTYAEVLASSVVADFLESASGEVEKEVMVGNRYTTDELNSLTDNSKAFLANLVCDIAFYRISQRRPVGDKEFPLYEEAKEVLEMIRRGNAVFNIEANKEAGNVEYAPYNVQVIASQNLISQNTQYFPTPWVGNGQ